MTANVTFVRHDGDPVAVSFGSWVDDRGIEGPQATPYAHHVVISTWIGMSSILDQPQIAHRREKYVGGPAKILEALHEKEKKRKRVKGQSTTSNMIPSLVQHAIHKHRTFLSASKKLSSVASP